MNWLILIAIVINLIDWWRKKVTEVLLQYINPSIIIFFNLRKRKAKELLKIYLTCVIKKKTGGALV